MREQLRVVIAVARDVALARIELAYFGFNMAEYATWMAILVYAYGLGGAAEAAVFSLVQLIPSGLVAPFAAYAGDRYRHDRVLLAGYLLQAVTLGTTAIALYASAPVPIVLLIATLAAVSFTITRPVQAVILPSITHSPGDLTAANAVSGLAENLGIFAGPLLGGILLGGRADPGDVFAAFAVLSLISMLLVLRLPIANDAVAGESASGVREILRASFGGFGVLRRQRRVLLLVLVLAATNVVIGTLDILFVATAIDLLRAGEAWAGFLFAAFGLGGIVGALTSVTLVGRRRLTPALAGSGGLFGLPISTVGLAPSIATAPVLFAASGAGSSITTVAGRTLLQRIAPEAVLARVFGVLEGLAMFAFALGAVVSGALVETLGITQALVVSGLMVPAVVIVAWIQLGALDRDARAPDPEALALLRRIPIFAPLSAPSIERILAELTWLAVPAGHVVIREGDPGDRFYILAEGRVEITQRGVRLSERDNGEYVGEIALLRNVPRTATVTALTPLRLIAIDGERFIEAVTGHAGSRRQAEAVAEERMPLAPAADGSASGTLPSARAEPQSPGHLPRL